MVPGGVAVVFDRVPLRSPAMETHQRLLSSGRIGPIELANRVVMPAMDQNSCSDDGEITDLTVAHYAARAAGGVGLLVLETSAVAYPIGATSRHQPALSDDRYVPGLTRLAEAVHEHGAKMVVQICHHGKTASVDAAEERAQLVPSVPLPSSDPQALMLDTTMDELMAMATLTGGKRGSQRAAMADDLLWVVDQFASAAQRVQRAGFDGVEIHAAHGYLLSSFLSPAYNRRTDNYGGTIEARARLMTDVIAAIRDRCGDSFAVIVRLDGAEANIAGGITVEMAARHAALAEAAGAHAIHVSAHSSGGSGWGFTDGPIPWQPNQYVDYARTVKAAVSIPVIAVGRIMPDAAEELLEAGDVCDFVAMGRQLLADAELVARLAEGRPELVRTCINCFVCVAQNFWDGKPVCAVNAELGHYDEGPLVPAAEPRRVAVVGGGPAGMEAARVAALRGHEVTLLERSSHLGGTARFSSLTTPANADLVRYLTHAIDELGVDVRLDTEAGPDSLTSLSPDIVVVATGARREPPDIVGADAAHVLSGDDLRALLEGDNEAAAAKLGTIGRLALGAGRWLRLTSTMDRVRSLSKRWMPIGDDVVVLGGGLVGVELAEFLAERGRRVTVLEPGPDLATEMAHPRRWRALHEARRHGVRFETAVTVTEISDTEVHFRRGDYAELNHVSADQVIVASGVVPDTALAERIAAAGHAVEVVGDAGEVRYIEGAIRSAHVVARAL